MTILKIVTIFQDANDTVPPVMLNELSGSMYIEVPYNDWITYSLRDSL